MRHVTLLGCDDESTLPWETGDAAKLHSIERRRRFGYPTTTDLRAYEAKHRLHIAMNHKEKEDSSAEFQNPWANRCLMSVSVQKSADIGLRQTKMPMQIENLR